MNVVFSGWKRRNVFTRKLQVVIWASSQASAKHLSWHTVFHRCSPWQKAISGSCQMLIFPTVKRVNVAGKSQASELEQEVQERTRWLPHLVFSTIVSALNPTESFQFSSCSSLYVSAVVINITCIVLVEQPKIQFCPEWEGLEVCMHKEYITIKRYCLCRTVFASSAVNWSGI